MTEATPAPKKPNPKHADADVVDAEVVEVETAHASPSEPVVATLEPDSAPAEPTPPAQQVVYVHAPAAPKKLGNRGIGSVLAIIAAIVFTALLALATALIGLVTTGRFAFGFLGQATFYIPTLFFLIGLVLVILVVNRANWWAYVIGSLVVGLIVYFGSIGLGLLSTGVVLLSPAEAATRFAGELRNPFIIVAALLAREVAIWTGAIVSRRGRRLKVRNAEARETWERELAEKRAEASGAPAAL
jgi:hypothetical protein